MHFKRAIPELLAASDEDIVRLLIDDQILPDLAEAHCPRCAGGRLSVLKVDGQRGCHYRCGSKTCQAHIQPHHAHPLFCSARGDRHVKLQVQAPTLLCLLADIPQSSISTILGLNHKHVERLSVALDEARYKCVLREEPRIQFGGLPEWVDVEADEVDLAKGAAEPDQIENDSETVIWEQWAGVVQRGRPESLVLFRLNPKKDWPARPGSGPHSSMRVEAHRRSPSGQPSSRSAH